MWPRRSNFLVPDFLRMPILEGHRRLFFPGLCGGWLSQSYNMKSINSPKNPPTGPVS